MDFPRSCSAFSTFSLLEKGSVSALDHIHQNISVTEYILIKRVFVAIFTHNCPIRSLPTWVLGRRPKSTLRVPERNAIKLSHNLYTLRCRA